MMPTDHVPRGARAKKLGAFYTDVPVAEFLVRWALRRPTDVVMDPSFGGGVFLDAACQRLQTLGGDPSRQVLGVELDRATFTHVAGTLKARWQIPSENLRLSDFFDVKPSPTLDVIVGNPPFIRYQRFTGEARQKALTCAARAGVKLNALSSSWTPFVVHAVAQLRQGGRLAMVLPLEIGHAAYARPVLKFLAASFRRVLFLTFRQKLFPDLSEDTLLVLADELGAVSEGFSWNDLAGPESLEELSTPESLEREASPLEARALIRGERHLLSYLVPAPGYSLYEKLKSHPRVTRLETLADVGIGYVTGANDYFHLHPAAARELGIEETYLRRAVRRGKSLRGIRYTEKDWEEGLDTNETGFLLHIHKNAAISTSLERYLARGRAEGVDQTFKCRNRSPWYSVPLVYDPDAFLTYMSGTMPRLVANSTGAAATNSLHVLRLREGARISAEALALSWHTSLTRLSAELEGHAMGGGMLKLEPTEAQRVLMAVPGAELSDLQPVLEETDRLVREGDFGAAVACADQEVLAKTLGLSPEEIDSLRVGADILQARRCGRNP